VAEPLIARLAGWVNEPYRKNEVLAAARKLQPPFLLREIVQATKLPPHTVSRVLTRLVRQGVLTRSKARMTTTGLVGGGRYSAPHGTVIRSQWLYSWAEPE
jgi:Fic family protein